MVTINVLRECLKCLTALRDNSTSMIVSENITSMKSTYTMRVENDRRQPLRTLAGDSTTVNLHKLDGDTRAGKKAILASYS